MGKEQHIFETLVFNPLILPDGLSETTAINVTKFMVINSHRHRDCLEGLNSSKEGKLTDCHIRNQVITDV